jgi:hypothetical protein
MHRCLANVYVSERQELTQVNPESAYETYTEIVEERTTGAGQPGRW